MNKSLIIRFVVYSIIFFIIIFYLIFKNKGVKEYFHIKKEYMDILNANKNMEKERKQLQTNIKKLKSDKKYIEKMAREKYNMIKNGEIVIKINKKGGKK
jgi:cell division protein FtsB